MERCKKNYREQFGCQNCRHAFVKREYEDEDEYFCALDAPLRPKCGSILMGESFCVNGFGFSNRKDYDDLYHKWEEWAKPRFVEKYGVCDSWEEKETKEY